MASYMNTKELSEYLSINEKKIYTLITGKKLPATKITGKWIFLKELVDLWIENSIENYPQTMRKLKGVLMIAGSNDPLLELVMNETKKTDPGFFPFFSIMGSLEGLTVLKNNKAHICGCHLLDTERKEYNFPFIKSYLPDFKTVAINFAYRQQGLIVKRNNPLKIKGIEDLSRHEIRLVNRQAGSGTRVLLDSYLKHLSIVSSRIRGYRTVVNTHWEVGLGILKGAADVGLGIKAVADGLGLGFIPLKEERFDLLIPQDYFFFEEVQRFLKVLRSSQFKQKAARFGGYDTRESGRVMNPR
ncbi:MAG: helix-turn-helix transcriptional regulator [Deltaproteobacteria bacterium]|nr:MAG: helix-turn-helix transcriptional regulator [Deltaproteobacteria bacterium]